MKLYLAGGFGVMNVIGRERELCERLPSWKRLFSYNYLILIHKSEILILKHEDISHIRRTEGVISRG